jgi:molecular chaperone GrpE
MDTHKKKVEVKVEDKRFHAEANGGSPTELAPAADAAESAETGATAGGSSDASAASAAEPQDTDWMAKAAEHLDLAQRKEAELRNYMQRVKRDIDDARRFAVEGLLADLFPALDALAQAGAAFKDTPDGENKLLDGVRGTTRLLKNALSKHGLSPINETGVAFDGHLHQALQVEEAEGMEHDTVAEVYAEGWRMGEHVLKPALVRVVKPA